MSNYARIINNTAVDVSTDPAAHFHPEIASQFVEVPATVQRGWHLENDEWTAPEPEAPAEPAVQYPTVSPVEFLLLFTSPERVAIKAQRQTDPALDDFFQLLEDPRLTQVRLGQPSVQEGLLYLEQLGLISDARKAEILTGNPS